MASEFGQLAVIVGRQFRVLDPPIPIVVEWRVTGHSSGHPIQVHPAINYVPSV